MLENKKILYTVLAISLAINFLVIGAAGSAAWHFKAARGDANWLDSRLDRAEQRVLRRLEGADRDLAEQVFRTRRPALTQAVSDLRLARTDFRRSLAQETPDPVELTAALDRSQAAARQINENVHGAIRDMAQGLSVEARRKIAARMHKHHDDE